MHQVYRQVYTHTQPVRRLEFTWAPVTYSVKKLDQNTVINQLLCSLKGPPPPEYQHVESWASVVAKEIQAVSQAAPDTLVLRKPVAPHPTVMVYFDSTVAAPGPKHDMMHNANLPVFIRAGDPVDVTRLKTFTLERERQPKRPTHRFRWISEPLGIACLTPR